MKLRSFVFIVISLLSFSGLQAQKYFTRSGKIAFTSEAPMETIEAINRKANSVLDVASGKIQFSVLVKAFHFEKALMQEHFNENYMESDDYPKAVFKGKIDNITDVDFNADGEYPVKIIGSMTIHGETNPVEASAKLSIADGQLTGTTAFEVAVADYGIVIPKVVRDNVAKTVKIEVDAAYELYNK